MLSGESEPWCSEWAQLGSQVCLRLVTTGAVPEMSIRGKKRKKEGKKKEKKRKAIYLPSLIVLTVGQAALCPLMHQKSLLGTLPPAAAHASTLPSL